MSSKNRLLNAVEGNWEFEGNEVYNPSITDIGKLFKTEDDFFFALKFIVTPIRQIVNTSTPGVTDVQLFISLLQPEFGVLTLEQSKNIIDFFNLTFPGRKISISDREIILSDVKNQKYLILRDDSFKQLQDIYNQMFDFDIFASEKGEYKPKDAAAQAIADKLAARHKKLAEMNKNDHKGGVIENYLSILSEEYGIPVKTLSENITLHNLFMQYKRLEMRISWELDIKTRLAGGSSNEQPPEMWLSLI